MSDHLRLFLLAGCLSLAGCATSPDQTALPAVPLPQEWATATPDAIDPPGAWWQNFGDPQLDGLIEQALQKNNDLAAAAIRVRRAQLQAGLVNTNRNPTVAVSANTGASRSYDPVLTSRSSNAGVSLGLEVNLGASWKASAPRPNGQHRRAATTAGMSPPI